MDIKKKMLLQHHQQDILDDLDVCYVLDDLFTRNVVSTEDYDYIVNLTSRVDKTRYLLERIVQIGTNDAYQAFVDSLAKDYHWLWEKLVIDNNEPMLNDSFEDSLSRGDVPRLPEHYVRRTALEESVKDELKLLKRHNFLVLHGMSGSGKTSIITSVLRENSDLITTNFNGVVFWLNFSKCKTEDDIVAQQNKLYRRATSHLVPHTSYMNSTISMSSIGSNADSHSLSSYDWTWQELRDRLKTQFAEQAVKEALLVLDEVNDKKCVEAFDVGCKIVITTGDTEVVSNLNPQIVKIENSFTERETLEFFASCLDTTANQLPRQAKKLHDYCKGSVFHIALIGAQLAENKERLNDDPRHWNYYLNSTDKKFFFLTRNHQNNNPMRTIEVCINSLKPNILPLFKMLCILPDNVKVSAKVLSKLWNKEVSEVEIIMKQLRSKSLIIEFYDTDQRNYMYEVHDLIMNYLRTCLTDEGVKKLHGEMLKSYNYGANPPVEIVDDGYIAFYVGYHILHTKNLNNSWQLFNKLYMDLTFLGNKVRLTGPADVILDLQKYESYIAEDDFDRELLHAAKSFLSTHGIDLYRYPNTDIVQSILQHETKGSLYTRALQVAQQKCGKNELFFEFFHEHNVEEIKPSNIDVKENITSVCFLGDYALVGTMNGLIKFFQISTNKLKKELSGQGSAIKWVGACPTNPPIVAALYYDGVIKVWYIDDLEQDEVEGVIEEEPEESYNNNYPSSVTIQPKRGPCINCRWANNEETLVTHTAKLIILYTASGDLVKVIDVFERDHREIICCIPSNNDRHVVAATTNGSQYLEVYDLTTKEKVVCFEETDIVLDMLTIPGSNRIVTLKDKEVLEHELRLNTGLQSNCNTCISKKLISCEDVKENLTFMCMAVNKTGTLLFVSTDDGRVICVDLKTNSRVFDLENRRGKVVSMAVSEVCDDFMPGSDVLLTGTGTIEDSAKVWYLDASYVSQTTRNGKIRLTTKFDVSFVHTLSPQSPVNASTSNGVQGASATPKRHQSFVSAKEVEKKVAKKTMSLDRHNIKPLVLKGICNGNGEENAQLLLAVVDDKNNVQIMRGRKILTEIPAKDNEHITIVKISPCNQYILYGTKSGRVYKYTLRTKETKTIMEVYSPVQYLNFVNPNLLVVAGKNKCLMAYRLTSDGVWKPEMLQAGNTHLGSQEILNDIQGKRKATAGYDRLSSSESESSITSRERLFSNGDRRRLSKPCGLAQCFWLDNIGLITVEHNATVKLWNQELKLATVLYGRQTDVHISCAAFQKNVLVICDDNRGFQTFQVKEAGLHSIQEYKLNNRIISCDLSADGYLLAMGLDSGDVVVWNVPGKRQLRLLKHHKTRVRWCSFSPVPDRLFRSNVNSPASQTQPAYTESDDEQPPLVLVTMASEIVWWNITFLIKMRANFKAYWRIGWNVVTPVASPMERSELTAPMEKLNLATSPQNNFFFGGLCPAQECWKSIWRKKTYKEGSKRKEILACIKLSGMNARKLVHDDKFACFVTVDNPGHIHIMNIMRSNS